MEVTLGQTLAAFVSCSLGAFLAISIGVSHKQLCALISFAAGTLLAATLFHIVPEAWQSGIPPLSIMIALASGYGLFFFLSRFVSHVCPACSASHFEEHSVNKFANVFFLLAIALTIHSLMDGAAISLSAKNEGEADHSVFFTVAIHKLPEGLALCALLLEAGHSRLKAFGWSLLLETSTILGWALGNWMLAQKISSTWLDLAMVHIAGGFVYLALHAAISEAKKHSSKLILAFFTIGFLFMALVK